MDSLHLDLGNLDTKYQACHVLVELNLGCLFVASLSQSLPRDMMPMRSMLEPDDGGESWACPLGLPHTEKTRQSRGALFIRLEQEEACRAVEFRTLLLKTGLATK